MRTSLETLKDLRMNNIVLYRVSLRKMLPVNLICLTKETILRVIQNPIRYVVLLTFSISASLDFESFWILLLLAIVPVLIVVRWINDTSCFIKKMKKTRLFFHIIPLSNMIMKDI